MSYWTRTFSVPHTRGFPFAERHQNTINSSPIRIPNVNKGNDDAVHKSKRMKPEIKAACVCACVCEFRNEALSFPARCAGDVPAYHAALWEQLHGPAFCFATLRGQHSPSHPVYTAFLCIAGRWLTNSTLTIIPGPSQTTTLVSSADEGGGGGGGASTNYPGPAARKRARIPTMLLMFFSFSVVSSVRHFSLPSRCRWDLRSCGLSSGNPLPTFRDNISIPSSRVLNLLTLEDGTDRLSRNVG
jgi:hypothetical protein